MEDIENGPPESVWVSNHLNRPVIKAYNSIFYRSLIHSPLPKGTPSRIALPIAGDEKKSKDLVSRLIDDSGFDCLDYGTLQDSWRQQPGSPVYCTDLSLSELKKSIVKAKRELLPARRELGLKISPQIIFADTHTHQMKVAAEKNAVLKFWLCKI